MKLFSYVMVGLLFLFINPGILFAQEAVWTNLLQQAKQLEQSNKPEEALQVATKALEVAKETFGNYHPHVSDTLRELSSLYISVGALKEAATLFEKSLQIDQRIYGSGHEKVADSHLLLAQIRFEENEAETAFAHLTEAIEILRMYEERKSEELLGALAMFAAMKTKYVPVYPLDKVYEEIVELQKTLNRPEKEIGLTYRKIAARKAEKKFYEEAKIYYDTALEIYRREFGNEAVETLELMNEMAAFHLKNAHYDQASALSGEALQLFSKKEPVLTRMKKESATTMLTKAGDAELRDTSIHSQNLQSDLYSAATSKQAVVKSQNKLVAAQKTIVSKPAATVVKKTREVVVVQPASTPSTARRVVVASPVTASPSENKRSVRRSMYF